MVSFKLLEEHDMIFKELASKHKAEIPAQQDVASHANEFVSKT